ncbi:sialidase [Maribellus comscasis]|uniref:exo-alpha-sialidase n=1 Tax=Maribellus comscasis TaxID=2681766 RepID=A0A6I6JMX3_9BACT|nr:sialidase family protein [Maribellus comscasis]QGY44265.1 sialidase [Maribellus comscasis]
MKTKLFFTIIWILILCIYFPKYVESANKNKTIRLESKQSHIPVLILKNKNPVLQTKMTVSSKKANVQKIAVSLDGTTDLNDIETVRLSYTKSQDNNNQMPFGKPVSPSSEIIFADNVNFENDTILFNVLIKLKDDANLFHKINASCPYFVINNKKVIPEKKGSRHPLRIGVAIRQQNDDNVHTFRIPGLTTTNKGTLLAIYDARRNSSRDLQGDIDIGVSRSTDGGNTWEPMRIGLDMGEWGGLPEKFNGASDPCILVDKNSNKIFLAGLWMYGVLDENGKWIENLNENSEAWNHQWRNNGSQPGFGVKQTAQFLIATSTDDGKTWSTPENLTQMCKKEAWWLWAPAPGHGITLEDGTLVFPTQGRDKNGRSFSNITYSTDEGKTWKTSQPAYSNTTENMVAQLDDGRLMLNARYNPNRSNSTDTNGRVVVTTNDLGQTWTEHPSSRSALIESTCMASIHKHIYHENGKEKSILLFSNPNTKTGRHHMTLKVSIDNGNTWPEEFWMLLDEGKSRGYSCITSIDENTVGILYEGSQSDLIFESIPLKEILDIETND